MPPNLPLIGVEAAILGMQAFSRNANTFNQLLLGMQRTARAVSKIISAFGGGGDQAASAGVRNAQRIEKAQLALKRTTESVAAATQRATDRVAAVQAKAAADAIRDNERVQATKQATIAAVQRAEQMAAKTAAVAAAQTQAANQRAVAAQSQVSRAQAKYAADVVAGSTRIARAKELERNAVERLRIQNELVAKAPTAAREAAAARAALTAETAANNVIRTQRKVATTLQQDQNAIANAQRRAGAAASASAAQQVTAATRVAAASNNVTNVQTANIRKVGAAQQAAASNTTANAARVTSAQNNLANVVTAGATRIAAANANVTATSAAAAGGIGRMALIAGGATLGIIALAVALYNLVQAFIHVVQASNTYQQMLTFIDVTAGTTGAQIAALSNQIMVMSRSTTTSAADLQAMTGELLKAGVSFEQVSTSALAAANSLVVASNGELDAARAAVSLAIATEAFHVGFAEAANAIQGAAVNSTLSLGNMADAIKQGGAVAARYKLDINEFAAAVALIGQVIPSGTEAGTQLRNILIELQTPTKQGRQLMNQYGISINDAAGNIRPFVDVIIDLERAFGKQAIATGKVTEQQRDFALATIFGQRQLRGISTILDQGSEEYLRLANVIKNSTSAADAAARMVNTNIGLTQQLSNNIAALGLAFGEGLDPYINAVIQSLLGLMQQIDPTLESTKNLGDFVGRVLVNAFFNAGEVIGGVVVPVLQFLGDMLSALGKHFVDWLGVWLAVADAFVQAAVELAQATSPIWEQLANLWGAVVNFIREGVAFIIRAWNGLQQGAFQLGVNIGMAIRGLAQAWADATNNVGENSAVTQRNFGGVANAAGQMANSIASSFSQLSAIVGRIFANIATQVNIFLDSLQALPVIGETVGAARAVVRAVGAVGGAVSAAQVQVQKFGAVGGEALGNLSAGAAASLESMAAASGDAMSRFGANINAATGRAGRAIEDLGARAQAALARLGQNLRAPQFRDFGQEIADRIKAARDQVDRARRQAESEPGTYAPEGTEPGGFPGGDDDGGKKAAEALKRAQDRLIELWEKYNREVTKLNEEAQEDVRNSYRKSVDAINEAWTESLEGIDEAVQEAVDRIQELNDERGYRQAAEARREALDEELEAASEAREEALEEIEVQHDRELEDLERLEEQKARIREQAFDRQQADAARARDEIREAEDRSFERSQEQVERQLDKRQELEEDALQKRIDAEEEALDKQQEAIEAALKREQDAREAALEADQKARDEALETRLDAEEKALEASQQLREDALNAELAAESRARDDALAIADINEEAADARAKAEAEYQEEIRIGVKQSIAAARRKAKLDDAAAKEAEARAQLTESQTERDDELEFERQQNARRTALEAQFESESLAREQAANEAKRALQIAFDAETLALRTESELALQALETQFEEQRLVAREAHERELTEIHGRHERERIALSDQLENERLQRSKVRAAEDRAFAEEQEAAKQRFIDAEETAQRERSRKAEDVARERKKILDGLAVFHRKEDEKRRAALTKELDDEEHSRRITQIEKERDDRILAIQQALAKKQEEIEKQLALELAAIDLNLDQAIKRMREAYVDELKEIMRDSGEQVGAEVQKFTDGMESAFGAVREVVTGLMDDLKAVIAEANAAAAAVRSIPSPPRSQPSGGGGGGGGGATIREGGKPGETPSEVYNYLVNTGSKPEDARKAAGLQYGGVVPGRYGSEQWVRAHGGEYFEGIGARGTAMAAVRAAESSLMRGMGGATTVNNSYAYNVNANYGRVQAEGSIRLDLSALVAMTSR